MDSTDPKKQLREQCNRKEIMAMHHEYVRSGEPMSMDMARTLLNIKRILGGEIKESRD